MVTLGMDYFKKTYQPINSLDETMQVKIWDTAGQERFRSLTQSFYKQKDGIILCFDVTARPTFDALKRWMTSIAENGESKCIKLIVATKCDLTHEREISEDEGKQLAKGYGVEYFETSAMYNTNITEAFDFILQAVWDAGPQEERKTFKVSQSADTSVRESAAGGCGC